jgi:hypothetical protein
MAFLRLSLNVNSWIEDCFDSLIVNGRGPIRYLCRDTGAVGVPEATQEHGLMATVEASIMIKGGLLDKKSYNA